MRQNTARGKRSDHREATPGRRRIEPATAGVVDLARVEETSASGRCDKYGDAPINLSSPEFSKHVAHIGDVRHIPIIERLIETLCTIKHLAHIDDVRCIPFVERLIETLCAQKHRAHIFDVRCIPIIERLIKTLCARKHVARIGDVRRIPFVE